VAPLDQTNASPGAAARGAPAGSLATAAGVVGAAEPGARAAAPPALLIVDQDAATTRTVARRLRAAGAVCMTAANAQEAMTVLDTWPVDLLIADMRVPGASGIELLRHAKSGDPFLQVILMTSDADLDTAVQALRENADDYLVKPFELDQLVHSARRALEHRSLVLENRSYRERLEEKVRTQARKLETAYLSGIRALVTALEAKDPQTRGHSARVTGFALALAETLGGVDLHALVLGAELHDIGKIGTREHVLGKPGALTAEEFDHIREHPLIGVRILSPILSDRTVLEIVRHHHERWNGGGYPDGLTGAAIPQAARVVAVADALDAMTSPRSYRATRTWEQALAEVAAERGRQFDPAVVDAALARLRTRPSVRASG
jgi:putative two-component system response regulator